MLTLSVCTSKQPSGIIAKAKASGERKLPVPDIAPRRSLELPKTLTQRFDQALLYATAVHAGQTRKATDIPYISHLLGVAAIALEHGANEDEAISALLHDAVEDAGGVGRLADIRGRFGDTVAEIVDGCTDTDQDPKPPWRARKEAYIAHLDQATPATRLVSCSDKLYNSRSIVADLRALGEVTWKKFNGGKEGTLWYYRGLVEAFSKGATPTRLLDEFRRVVEEIERLAAVK